VEFGDRERKWEGVKNVSTRPKKNPASGDFWQEVM